MDTKGISRELYQCTGARKPTNTVFLVMNYIQKKQLKDIVIL